METKSFSGKLSEAKVVIRLIAGATLLGLINLYGHPGILAYGGLIEVLQSFTGYRFAEWNDLLADAMGLLLGWSLWLSARTIRARR